MDALESLSTDLRSIFGDRLHSIIVYEAVTPGSRSSKARTQVHTLALVAHLTFDDLAACAARSEVWDRLGLATPLIMARSEFARSLDAFPLEYGQIIARHRVLDGVDPFEGLAVKAEDLRRACEVQAKSHLLHLRQAYMEAGGRPSEVARLIVASVAPFKALLASVARLRGGSSDHTPALAELAETMGLQRSIVERVLELQNAQDQATAETARLFPAYLETAEQLARHVDQWQR